MRTNVPTWLWCMWKAQRIYRAKGAFFSSRQNFLKELRPFIGDSEDTRVAYPDAIFWITPKDVARAQSLMTDK